VVKVIDEIVRDLYRPRGWPAGTRWLFDHAETVTQPRLDHI
jgi:hypothetical protein